MVGRLYPVVALLALAGCGYKGEPTRLDLDRSDLSKEEKSSLRAADAEKVRAGLTPPPQAQPQRVDEILKKPAERTDDPFNLPPQ